MDFSPQPFSPALHAAISCIESVKNRVGMVFVGGLRGLCPLFGVRNGLRTIFAAIRCRTALLLSTVFHKNFFAKMAPITKRYGNEWLSQWSLGRTRTPKRGAKPNGIRLR